MTRSNIRERQILFLSHENDCLSFIAEAIAKKLLPPKTQVFSARLKEGKIDPKAVRVLQEIGIDASAQEPKRLNAIPIQDIDLVVRLGESGEGHVTVTPGAKCRTWDITDPCQQPTEDLDAFRHAR